jgi:hypothetical protein
MNITCRARLAQCLLTAMLALAGSNVWAQGKSLSIGIAATVGDAAGLLDVKENFSPITSALANAIKGSAEVSPVQPTMMKATLDQARLDLLVVLTSDAWRAQNDNGWRILALSDDSEGNVVVLASRKELKATAPADMKGRKIASSGTFAREVTIGLLKQNGIVNQVGEIRDTRDPDALPYFLTNGFADIVATRDAGVIKKLTDSGANIFFKTDPIPVYAIIANPKMPLPILEKLKQAAVSMTLPSDFVKRSHIKSFKAVSADHAVALALFD